MIRGEMSENDKTNGRWTKDQHQKFLIGLQLYGKNWKKIESMIVTRNGSQIRSHAQKYFLKLSLKNRAYKHDLENIDIFCIENQEKDERKKQKKIIKTLPELNSPDFWMKMSELTSLPEFRFWDLIDRDERQETPTYLISKSFETYCSRDKVLCPSWKGNIQETDKHNIQEAKDGQQNECQ